MCQFSTSDISARPEAADWLQLLSISGSSSSRHYRCRLVALPEGAWRFAGTIYWTGEEMKARILARVAPIALVAAVLGGCNMAPAEI
jgi:hypothetical protein